MKYDFNTLNIDERFLDIQRLLEKENLEFVLVKGIVWNKGQLLDGADLDFYVRQGGKFVDYHAACSQGLVESLFPGVLVSPRKTDFEIPDRVGMFYVDAEMTLAHDYAILEFANHESRDFFENGHYDCPASFEPNIKFVRFILNRFLEKTGSGRQISGRALDKARNFSKNLPTNTYKKMFSSFSRKNGIYVPSENLDYKILVQDHFSQGGKREDLIFIKPLNQAYKKLNKNE